MCDICGIPCKVCGKMLPVHIADFCVERNTFDVFCEEHIPAENCIEFTALENENAFDEDVFFTNNDKRITKGWRIAVRHHDSTIFPIKCMHHSKTHPCLHNIRDAVEPNSYVKFVVVLK